MLTENTIRQLAAGPAYNKGCDYYLAGNEKRCIGETPAPLKRKCAAADLKQAVIRLPKYRTLTLGNLARMNETLVVERSSAFCVCRRNCANCRIPKMNCRLSEDRLQMAESPNSVWDGRDIG